MRRVLQGSVLKKRHQIIFGLVLALIALIGGQTIFATPVFGVTDASITINISQPISLNLMPGTFDSTSQNVIITTTNYTGYTAQLTNPNNSTDLVNTTNSSLAIPTITLPQGSSSITQNQFTSGYGLSTDGTNYVPAPTSAVGLSLGDRNSAGTGTHNIYLGALTSVTTTPGTYTKTYTIVALANDPQYSITYNANAGTDTVTNMPSNQPITSTTASTITLSNNVPARDYYTFLGWDTDPTVTTPTYPTGNTNTITIEPTQSNAATLYAIWGETGDVKITSVSYVSGINVSGTPQPTVDSNGDVNFDLTFLGGLDNTDTLQATYRLTVTNTTPSNYSFTPPASNLKLRISPTEVRDISYE